MTQVMNHDEEEHHNSDPERCCDDHGLMCSVVETAHEACCRDCPEWGEPLWH